MSLDRFRKVGNDDPCYEAGILPPKEISSKVPPPPPNFSTTYVQPKAKEPTAQRPTGRVIRWDPDAPHTEG